MGRTGMPEEGFDLLYRNGLATLAQAEARLGLARGALAPDDGDALARFVMDAAAALLLLRARADGDLDPARFRREADRLKLDIAPALLARLPQAARIGVLEVHALAARLAAAIARPLAEPNPPDASPKREKPRRRPGRPRLHLVSEWT